MCVCVCDDGVQTPAQSVLRRGASLVGKLKVPAYSRSVQSAARRSSKPSWAISRLVCASVRETGRDNNDGSHKYLVWGMRLLPIVPFAKLPCSFSAAVSAFRYQTSILLEPGTVASIASPQQAFSSSVPQPQRNKARHKHKHEESVCALSHARPVAPAYTG